MRCSWIALVVALVAGCTGTRPPVTETGRSVSLSLDVSDEEHSKDSNGRRSHFELTGGVLTAVRSWSGSHGGAELPAQERTRAELADGQLRALIDRLRASGLDRPSEAETGTLDGPGRVETFVLDVTLDGNRSRIRSVHRKPWNGGQEAGPRHAALQELHQLLAGLLRGDPVLR
jgi:hypothetical protein